MTENIEAAGCPVDIEAAEQQAESDVVAQREEALAAQLKEMRKRKRRLVDPLQYEMSISAQDLSSYVPAFGWECAPPTENRLKRSKSSVYFPTQSRTPARQSFCLTASASAAKKVSQRRNRYAF